MDREIYDVFIVGGGPAAFSAAMTLKDAKSIKIALGDKSHIYRPCGGAITCEAKRLLNQFGIDIERLPSFNFSRSVIIQDKDRNVEIKLPRKRYLALIKKSELNEAIRNRLIELALGEDLTVLNIKKNGENIFEITCIQNNLNAYKVFYARYVIDARGAVGNVESTHAFNTRQIVLNIDRADVPKEVCGYMGEDFSKSLWDLNPFRSENPFPGYGWVLPSSVCNNTVRLNIGLMVLKELALKMDIIKYIENKLTILGFGRLEKLANSYLVLDKYEAKIEGASIRTRTSDVLKEILEKYEDNYIPVGDLIASPLPLLGEGIRPALIEGELAAKSILDNGNVPKNLFVRKLDKHYLANLRGNLWFLEQQIFFEKGKRDFWLKMLGLKLFQWIFVNLYNATKTRANFTNILFKMVRPLLK